MYDVSIRGWTTYDPVIDLVIANRTKHWTYRRRHQSSFGAELMAMDIELQAACSRVIDACWRLVHWTESGEGFDV